jgi:hypothetical protein
MTAVVPSVTDDVMEALQAKLKPEVDALARESVLAEMRKAQDTMRRFYWSPETTGGTHFRPVIDEVFGPGVWDRGMVVEIDPVIAARVSLAPAPPAEQVARCQCQHCGNRDRCRGDCTRCGDRTCVQCNPGGRVEDDDLDDEDERTCECEACEDRACQGDCDTCGNYGTCEQCHPNLRTCCGYCERCDMCHTEQAEYGEGYCAECEHCRECDHDCNVEN